MPKFAVIQRLVGTSVQRLVECTSSRTYTLHEITTWDRDDHVALHLAYLRLKAMAEDMGYILR